MSIAPGPLASKTIAWSCSFPGRWLRLACITILFSSVHRRAYRPSEELGSHMLSAPEWNDSSALLAVEQLQGVAENVTGRADRRMRQDSKGAKPQTNRGLNLEQMVKIIMLEPDHRATFLLGAQTPGGPRRVEIKFLPNREFFMRWGRRNKSNALDIDVHRMDTGMVQEFLIHGLDFTCSQTQADDLQDILRQVLGTDVQLSIRPLSPDDMRSVIEDMESRRSFRHSGSGLPQPEDMNSLVLKLGQEQIARILSSDPPCMWPTPDQLDLIREKTVTFHVTPGFGFSVFSSTIKKFSLEVRPSEMDMRGAETLKAKIYENIKEKFKVDVGPDQIAVGRLDQNGEPDSLDPIFSGDSRRGIGDENLVIYQLVHPRPFHIIFVPEDVGDVKFGLGKPFHANLRLSTKTRELKEMIAKKSEAQCALSAAEMSLGYGDYVDFSDEVEIWRYDLNPKSRIKVRGGEYGGMTLPDKNIILVRKLGHGSVYLGYNYKYKYDLAVKIPRSKEVDAQEEVDMQKLVYKESDGEGFINANGFRVQNFPYEGRQSYVITMDLLGRSLEDLLKHMGKFSKDLVCFLAAQMIARLKTVHDAGLVYRNVKPDNFMMGLGRDKNTVYLSDFELVHDIGHASGSLVGTARYCSIDAHLGKKLFRYSDLEAVGYVLSYFLKGELPWEGLRGDFLKIRKGKENASPETLFDGEDTIFVRYMQKVRQQKAGVQKWESKGDEMPNYDEWIKQFTEATIGKPQFPSFLQVAQRADVPESFIVHTR